MIFVKDLMVKRGEHRSMLLPNLGELALSSSYHFGEVVPMSFGFLRLGRVASGHDAAILEPAANGALADSFRLAPNLWA